MILKHLESLLKEVDKTNTLTSTEIEKIEWDIKIKIAELKDIEELNKK